MSKNITSSSARTMGTILAIALSWATNHGFWWAVWHAICGWFYVIYWGFKYANLEEFIKNFMVNHA